MLGMSVPEGALPEGPLPPYLRIVRDVIDKITTGEIKAGDKIPSVTELGKQHQVSHGTARRALAVLKAWGITETVPGYATYIRALRTKVGEDQDQPHPDEGRPRQDAPGRRREPA